EPLPFQLGDFLDQLLHLAIVGDGSSNTFLPCLGDADLARVAGMTLHQVQGLMQFAFGAMAAGFAAFCGTLRKGTTQEPPGGSQLRNPRPEITLGSGEFGAAGGVGHGLYIDIYKITGKVKGKTTIRICSPAYGG